METVIWIIVAVTALLALMACYAALKNSQQIKLLRESSVEQLKALQHELTVVNSGAIGVGQRLIATEKKLKNAIDKQQQIESHNVDLMPFSQAADMAEQGADATQLVERFGLSEAEASLVALLQARRSPEHSLKPSSI